MFDEEATLQKDAVFSIGKVTSVEGRRVRVTVNKLKNSSHLLFRGDVVRNVSVGSYIKIAKGFIELVASVDGERVEEDSSASRAYKRSTDMFSRQLEVSLVGYFENGAFNRGVREMPLLDNECFILTEQEFQAIHTFTPDPDQAIQLGTLAIEPTQPVKIGVDSIFASHVGIFGNTGSGKSYSLAKLYYELFDKYASAPGFHDRAQFLLIDFNGEYVNRADNPEGKSTAVISATDKLEYRLRTDRGDGDKLPLPASAVTDPTFWTVLLDATEKTQAPFLSRVLKNDFWDRQLAEPEDLMGLLADMVLKATKSTDLTIDRGTVLNLLEEVQTCLGEHPSGELADLIKRYREELHWNATQRVYFWGSWGSPYQNTSEGDAWPTYVRDPVANLNIDFSHIQPGIDLVRFKIVLQYYSDIISGFSNREHLSPLIKRMEERVPDIKKLITVSEATYDQPLVVVSLRNVNLAMRKVIPMLLCKHLYDKKKLEDPHNETVLNLIIDEAHNILSLESSRESEAWRDYRLETFEEIIKEGRKFGVFLTIASQRPHDISPTIISQLHNYFLHRLVNDLDIKAVEKAVAYLDRVSFESLPILPTGVCILAGVAAQIPVMLKVGELAPRYEPNSRTMSVVKSWMTPLSEGSAPEAVSAVIVESEGDEFSF
ncbi:ATP-binding protein [Microbacterium neimengense]